jgi:hypothetical protein
MKPHIDDITKKSCNCGGIKEQVLTVVSPEGTQLAVPVRIGWYCKDCRGFEEAILRERVVSGLTEEDIKKDEE